MAVVAASADERVEEVRVVDRREDQRWREHGEVETIDGGHQKPKVRAPSGEEVLHPARTEQIQAAVDGEDHAGHARATPQTYTIFRVLGFDTEPICSKSARAKRMAKEESR